MFKLEGFHGKSRCGGESDDGTKKIFADFVNGIVYHGEQVLKPEGLECISGQPGILYEAASGKICALEQRRDIQMKADMGMYSVIFAEESQIRVHYAMPVRSMLYDALEYVRQIQEIEKGHREREEQRPSGLLPEILFFCKIENFTLPFFREV